MAVALFVRRYIERRYTAKVLTRRAIRGFIAPMKTKTSLVSLVVWLAAGTLCFAANPQMRTWKLNEKKSKITPGTQKNMTVTYQSMLVQTKVTGDSVDGKGNPIHSEWMGAFDGKDHAVKGNPNEDMRAYRKIDDRTLEFTSKKGGKAVVQGRVIVAADGKSRTVTTDGMMENGKKFHNVAVYDKQ